jgi:hypothetical protein
VWLCRNDPRIKQFCANAVLTMHRVAAQLNARDTLHMLIEEQLHSVGQCLVVERRELADAGDGAGVAGTLAMRVAAECGTLDTRALTRVVPTASATLIAQLTLTAMQDSAVGLEPASLVVQPDPAASGGGSASAPLLARVPDHVAEC